MATKDKDKKGPATQSTGTQGVNAVGVNHGTKPNYAPGFTDVPGSPSYQQYGPQQVQQQAPVVAQPVQQVVPQQVQPQTATNVQQNPVVQPTQTSSAPNSVQPVAQQQFVLPQQITMPNGQVINMQPQVPQQPASVNIKGVGTVQAPNMHQPVTTPTQSQQPTAAQQNAEYEAQKQQEAEKEQYNQLVGEYMKAGGNPNAIRQHNDPNMEGMQPTPEQVQQAQANTQKQAQTDNDEYIKTLKEYLDSKYEPPEDREAREKREARQRKWAAISEGIANVFNVGGSIAGARPAQWKSGVGELYANQEAESDKRRAEYREALKDMMAYKTAIRNGDIAQARAIEERRRNDYLEQKALADIASKEQANRIAQEKHENNEKRAQVKADDQHRAANTKEEIDRQKLAGTYSASKNTPKKSSSKRSSRSRSRRGSKTQKGRTSNGTQKQTAAAAASKNGVH